MRPEPSCSVAKLALPITRFSIMRPATTAAGFCASISSLPSAAKRSCSAAARSRRRKSFGYASPAARSAFSFSRRSSISLLSSCSRLDPLLQARFDEVVEFAVEHALRVAFLDAGAQILVARLVEHVRADLVPPLDVGLLRRELVLRRHALPELELVEPRLEHRHAFGTIAVLRAVVLALHDDAARDVGDAHGGLRLVDVLAAGAGSAVDVDAQVGGVDVDLDRLVDLGIDEDAGERGVPAGIGVERAFAHQA